MSIGWIFLFPSTKHLTNDTFLKKIVSDYKIDNYKTRKSLLGRVLNNFKCFSVSLEFYTQRD